MKRLMYPGSFDPVTNGHLDVIRRASRIADEVLVAVARNSEKSPLFTTEERIELIRAVTKSIENVRVVTFTGLLADAVSAFGVSAVIRGLRAVSDFEYEFQMALMNRELNRNCETIFMMTSPEYSFVSSRLIKEIAFCGGDISSFVPDFVADAIHEKARNGQVSLPGVKPRG